jgi:hypothetical protein
MFPNRYFPADYFAPRYFPKTGAAAGAAIIGACAVLIQALKPLSALILNAKPTADVTQRPC